MWNKKQKSIESTREKAKFLNEFLLISVFFIEHVLLNP